MGTDQDDDQAASPIPDDWTKRRLRLDLVLVLFGSLLSYTVVFGHASAVDSLVAPALIAGIASLIATYVFGAVWSYKLFLSR